MARFGSSGGITNQQLTATVDSQGNQIINSDTSFGASPLGYAPLVQALFGLPNATFELTPPDTGLPIDASNPLPYWRIDNVSDVMAGSAVYDSTTNAWAVQLNPGTAPSGDYITLTTRSYLINDDNLNLRQQALAVVSKGGTYSGTTQWNMELTAAYYSESDTLLHSGTVATIYDNATWTSMAGTTTTGGTAISALARYVDLQFKLAATSNISSSTSVTVKSLLLATSVGATASRQFLVTDTYTASDTWVAPTGVETLVAVVAQAGGGGGGGGTSITNSSLPIQGATGGGGGALVIARDIQVTSGGSYVVTVGAGGAGGLGARDEIDNDRSATAGSAGGATSLGSLVSASGGVGGLAAQSGGTTSQSGGAGGTASYGGFSASMFVYLGNGGAGGSSPAPTGNLAGSAGSNSGAYTTGGTPYPFVSLTLSAGTNGAAGTSLLANIGSAGTGGAADYVGGGGGAAAAQDSSGAVGAGGNGGAGGGGGAGATHQSGVTGTRYGTAGNGGSAGANTGGGGGAGGSIATAGGPQLGGGARLAGDGGAGASGFIVIAYVG